MSSGESFLKYVIPKINITKWFYITIQDCNPDYSEVSGLLLASFVSADASMTANQPDSFITSLRAYQSKTHPSFEYVRQRHVDI